MWLHMHVPKMGISNTATLSIVALRKKEFEVAFTDNFMPAKPKRLVGKCICQSFPQMFLWGDITGEAWNEQSTQNSSRHCRD